MTFPASPTNVPRVGDYGHAPGGSRVQDDGGRFVGGGFAWAWEGIDGVMHIPDLFGAALLEATRQACDEIAVEMQEYAKANAPWEDRTTDAREGLKTVVVVSGDSYSVFLGYSVPYGIYLETANGGVFAVVRPTVEYFAPLLAGRVRERVHR